MAARAGLRRDVHDGHETRRRPEDFQGIRLATRRHLKRVEVQGERLLGVLGLKGRVVSSLATAAQTEVAVRVQPDNARPVAVLPGEVEVALALIFLAVDSVDDEERLAAFYGLLEDEEVRLLSLLVLRDAHV